MPSTASMLTFAAASFALIVIPGPAVMYVVTRSIHQGRRAGVVSAAGVDVGILFHVAAAVAGLSALLAASAFAFTTLKLAGAAYLILIGIRTLLDRSAHDEVRVARAGSLWSVFGQGVVVQVLNPKTALFFLAFLPQFVDPARGAESAQLLVLGLTFFAIALVSDTAYAMIAGTAAGRLRAGARFERIRRVVAGTVTIVLGITAAFAGEARRH